MEFDSEFEIELRGDTQQIKSMLEVIEQYGKDDERNTYLSDIRMCVNGNRTPFNKFKCDDFSAEKVSLYSDGPYGDSFDGLDEAEIFFELAETVPQAAFHGKIDEEWTYGVKSITAELKKGLLIFDTYCEDYEEGEGEGEAWAADVESKLDEDEFIELFELSDDCFVYDSYNYLLQRVYDEIDRTLKYADFMSIFGSHTEISKERYRQIIKNEIPEYGILSPAKFLKTYEVGEREHSEYDPIAKKFTVKSYGYM